MLVTFTESGEECYGNLRLNTANTVLKENGEMLQSKIFTTHFINFLKCQFLKEIYTLMLPLLIYTTKGKHYLSLKRESKSC